MAVVQTSPYPTSIPVGLPGMIVNGELANIVSRTNESTSLGFGQPAFRGADPMGVVIGATQAGTAAAVAGAGNVGNGAMGAITVSAGALPGRYVLQIVEPGTDAGLFTLSDPDGVTVGEGAVAAAFTGSGLAFTLADGATDFAAGDIIFIDVTLTANVDFVGLTKKDVTVPPLAATPDAYPQYWTAAIMDKGVMWVTAGGTVTDGQRAYWNPATSRFTATTTHVPIPNGKFESNGGNGDLVKLRIR